MEHFRSFPQPCAYLPQEMASLEYRILREVSAGEYGEMLRRGWRRFGREFFRPACAPCDKCRSLRLPLGQFQPSRSQRRAVERNAHVRVVVGRPGLTPDHLHLCNLYHADMHFRRGWPLRQFNEADYWETFLDGDWSFAREFRYFDGNRLVGVGLADVVPGALSSVYFYHDPDWRANSPGVFSVMQQIQYGRQHGLGHQYLGYWIAEYPSMAYKSRYRPHELLVRLPSDDEGPMWRLVEPG
jgi:arginine-tRNA-protein transferase